jgi:hypothetical protein
MGSIRAVAEMADVCRNILLEKSFFMVERLYCWLEIGIRTTGGIAPYTVL